MIRNLQLQPSITRLFIKIVMIFLFSSILVYFIPYRSGQPIDGAFDAYSYAFFVNLDKAFATSFQRFLGLYPESLAPYLQFPYAVFLHTFIIAPIFLIMSGTSHKLLMSVCGIALLIPESTIFMGCPSKEALGICAVISLVAFHLQFTGRFNWTSVFLISYSLIIAELSRPGFSIVFLAAIVFSLLPYLSSRGKINLSISIIIVFAFVLVLILGPYYDNFTRAYQDARSFLIFFESDLGSESRFKAVIRGVFLIAFSDDKPGLAFIFIAILFAIAKSIIYLCAIPLVSLPDKLSMPFYTWALSWQVASSISSVYCIWMFFVVYREKIILSQRAKGILLLAISLLFLISVSTAIFHVRYRAPAIVAFVAAFSVAHFDAGKIRLPPWIVMQILYILTACIALIQTR